jgi:hypothetical protein
MKTELLRGKIRFLGVKRDMRVGREIFKIISLRSQPIQETKITFTS